MLGAPPFAFVLLLATIVQAATLSLNTTVNDTDRSIRYSPAAAWRSKSKSAAIDEDPLSRTWHDGGDSRPLRFARYETNSGPVIMEFEFTGSAIYVYAHLPFSPSLITSTIDDLPLYTPLHGDSNVLSRENLSEAVHHLQVTVQNGAVFSFDYLIYTRSVPSDGDPTQLNLSTRRRSVEDNTTNDEKSHKNVATFAGAIGGCVGALALISLVLAISIIRRRRRTRSRRQQTGETEDVSSLFTDGSHDRPVMQGPTPFVPRYFPGTVLPPPPAPAPLPPPYESTSTLPVVGGEEGEGGVDYAGRPPPTPPPHMDGVAEEEGEERVPPANDSAQYPQLPPSPVETPSGSQNSIPRPPGLST